MSNYTTWFNLRAGLLLLNPYATYFEAAVKERLNGTSNHQ